MIMITGGLGFFGTGLARYLIGRGEEVLLTRRRSAEIPASLQAHIDKSVKVADCDILDFPNLMAVLKKHPVTSIIHAAVVIPLRAPLYQVVKTSVEGTANILEAARLKDLGRVTVTSSLTVYYGPREEMVYRETLPLNIDVNHPIASEKIAAEAVCNLYAHEYGIDVMIVRPSMIYGPSKYGSGPLGLMVHGVVKQKKAVITNFSPDYSMDFLHIEDCSRAIGTVHLAKEPRHKVYTVAYGKSYYLHEIAEIIEKLVPGAEIELKGSSVPWSLFTVDVSRLRDEFGFQPAYDPGAGIRHYIDELNLAQK